MGFGIGKEIGRERDEATEGWKVDFGDGKWCWDPCFAGSLFGFCWG